MIDTERFINEVNASMAMEGMPLSEDDKERIRRILADPKCADEIRKQLILKHKTAAARK